MPVDLRELVLREFSFFPIGIVFIHVLFLSAFSCFLLLLFRMLFRGGSVGETRLGLGGNEILHVLTEQVTVTR